MRRSSKIVALLLSLALVLAPGLAMARVGGGLSMGSRGSRTYSAPPATGTTPYGAAPMQRSLTQPGSSYGGGYNTGYGTGYGGYGGGYGRSFGTGLAGGLLGYGLGHMLFGGYGGYGGGFGHFGGGGLGVLGLLLRLAIIFFVVRWVFRRFFRRGRGFGGGLFAPRMAGGYGMAPGALGLGAGPAPQLASPPVAIQAADYAAFETLLKNIQAAWSNADLNALRAMASPELVSYFAEQLADYASRGQRNVVGDVRLQKGDLSESWAEANRIYATVAMRFSMTDTTYDKAGHVVDGSPNEHVTATEYWTFLRASGGQWMLSAIQQGR